MLSTRTHLFFSCSEILLGWPQPSLNPVFSAYSTAAPWKLNVASGKHSNLLTGLTLNNHYPQVAHNAAWQIYYVSLIHSLWLSWTKFCIFSCLFRSLQPSLPSSFLADDLAPYCTEKMEAIIINSTLLTTHLRNYLNLSLYIPLSLLLPVDELYDSYLMPASLLAH